jgi:hypothetical protein
MLMRIGNRCTNHKKLDSQPSYCVDQHEIQKILKYEFQNAKPE